MVYPCKPSSLVFLCEAVDVLGCQMIWLVEIWATRPCLGYLSRFIASDTDGGVPGTVVVGHPVCIDQPLYCGHVLWYALGLLSSESSVQSDTAMFFSVFLCFGCKCIFFGTGQIC